MMAMGDRTRWSIEFERARQARGLGQAEVAEALNISVQTVRNWSQAHSVASVELAVRLGAVLDVAPIRVLDWAGHVPGMADLVLYTEQLQEYIRADEEARLAVSTDGVRGVGLVAQQLAATGRYPFAIRPWWRGTGHFRRHFGDWVMVDPLEPDVTRAQIRKDVWGSLRYTAAYWNGPEDWAGHIDPPRRDLVICVQRFHAQRRGQGFSLPEVPRSIAVFGQYWCGHTETARMICAGLDYDFSCVGLVAATQYGYLPDDERVPGSQWFQSRVELTRTFTMDAELGRPRVWAADVWEDIRPLEIALSKSRLPYVFYLRPSDEMIEYGALVRTQHRMTELHEHGEAERMRGMRDKATELVARADPARSRVLQIELDPALGGWRTAVPANAEDIWFDTYAMTAKKALRVLLPPDRLGGALRAAGLVPSSE
jgi:transcriptional regulator with XRE-family HTH domain